MFNSKNIEIIIWLDFPPVYMCAFNKLIELYLSKHNLQAITGQNCKNECFSWTTFYRPLHPKLITTEPQIQTF